MEDKTYYTIISRPNKDRLHYLNAQHPADPVNKQDLSGDDLYSSFDQANAQISLKVGRYLCGGWWAVACATNLWELRALPLGEGGVRGGVYIVRTEAKKLYVGQTRNFSVRAAQHARAGKIAMSARRVEIPIRSKNGRNFAERTIYYLLGGKDAPWLENKIRPPRWW